MRYENVYVRVEFTVLLINKNGKLIFRVMKTCLNIRDVRFSLNHSRIFALSSGLWHLPLDDIESMSVIEGDRKCGEEDRSKYLDTSGLYLL